MWVEDGLNDLVLTIESQLGSTLHTQTEDVNETVWLIHICFTTLAITRKENLWLSGRPVDTGYSPIKLCLFLEREFLGQFASSFITILLFITIILSEERLHQVKFLTKGTLHDTRTALKEALELWASDDLIDLSLGDLFRDSGLGVSLLLTLWTKLRIFFLSILVGHASTIRSSARYSLISCPLREGVK
jgi:hypothetical protein